MCNECEYGCVYGSEDGIFSAVAVLIDGKEGKILRVTTSSLLVRQAGWLVQLLGSNYSERFGLWGRLGK